MSVLCRGGYGLTALLALALIVVSAQAQEPNERRLVDLTNEARTQAGLKPVVWDAKLAAAAHAHAVRMAAEAEISHRYADEADLPERAASAGAHFSVIAENIAQGTSPGQIHGAWMQSQVHHDNLMNANMDHIGVALVAARGALYAVADFTQSVASIAPAQIEQKVGAILQGRGLTLMADPSGARQYCALEDGASGAGLGLTARFLMRWQNTDIGKLPPELEKALRSGQFKQASVGSCATKGSGAAGPVFSGYRVAVLLY
jgi:hypothetical protein